jgi:hypothetical protein
MMARPSLVITLALVTIVVRPATAQNIRFGGAVQRDVQRFPEDLVPNRLDGAATGWIVHADAQVWKHLILAVEWSDAGTIEDLRTITLEFAGRPIAITSSFKHRTRALNTLAGYSHTVSSRLRLAYLVGIAFTNLRREFASDAPGLVLVLPSDRTTFASTMVNDRFRKMTGGVDALVRIKGPLHAMTGVRAQRLTLLPDSSGWSVRIIAGAGWVF